MYSRTVFVDNSLPDIVAAEMNKVGLAIEAAYYFYNPKDSAYGAKGDGATDDTTALSAWIGAMNASAPGAIGVVPPGQYMISAPLPPITAAGVRIMGAAWAQTAFTKGSVISTLSGWSDTAAMLRMSGEGCDVRDLTIDGAGRPTTCVAVTAANCRFGASVHGVAAGGVCLDAQAGAVSLWVLPGCRINGINFPNTGIQVNDTDAIILGCKPTNNSYNVVLLGGASGAIIANNHMTPGAGGANCIWINGNPSHVQIADNRFDNYVQSGIQITPPASTPNSIKILGNHFHSTVITDNTYAAIALDTTASGVRALQILGNSVYGAATNRPKWFLAAQKQDGTTPTNTSRLASLGSLVNGNDAWAATAFFGNANPTIARGNLSATDGQTYAAVADI
jgi:hypothetical protein